MADNPSADQLLGALEKAHLAGDTQAARELAAWHNELYVQPETPEPGLMERAGNLLPEQPSQVEQISGGGILGFGRGLLEPQQGPQYDGVIAATGKALANVPERFQQSAAGAIQLLGESLSTERARRVNETSAKLGITPGDYRLLAWAGNEGLIDAKTPIPEALDYIKTNLVGSLDEQQLSQVEQMGIINPEDLTRYANEWRQQTQATMEPMNTEPGSLPYYTSAAIGSVAEMGPALLAGILTRNPAVTMGIMGGQVTGQQYAEGREKGLSVDDAQTYAAVSAMAEAIPEALPLAVIMRPGTLLFKRLAQGAVAEAGQEVVTEAIQVALDKQMVTPDMTWKEARQRMIDAGIIGSMAGPMMSGAAHPIIKAQEKAAQAINTPQRQLGAAMNEAAETNQFAQPSNMVAAQQLEPQNAQLVQVPSRPSMKELVAQKVRERQQNFSQTETVMPPNVAVPFAAPPIQQQSKEEPLQAPERERKPDPAPQNDVTGMTTQEVPVAELSLSDEVPQFKEGANKQGVVEPLGGQFDRTGVSPIQVWRRTDGRLEVISGRHRLDLARRSGEQTIPAQVHDEASGFDRAQAATLDAELNIRDNQGKVKDYVQYFQATGISREEADQRGYTARALGRRAYTIATRGSEETLAAHRADILTDDAAERIASTAPGDSRLQAVGIKAIQDGKSTTHATNMMQAVQALGQPQGDGMGDMFGFDDSAMREAEAMARLAARKQREISDLLRPQKAVANAGKLAEQEGITDNLNAEQRKQRMDNLQSLKSAWDTWSTNPDLVAELRREIQGEETPVLSSYSEAELQQQADQVKQSQQAEQQAQSRYDADQQVDDFNLTGSNAHADIAMAQGQNDMFTQTIGQAEAASKPPANQPDQDGYHTELVKQAYAGTSNSPGAAARLHKESFDSAVSDLQGDLEQLAATPEQQAVAADTLQRFKSNYLKREKVVLDARAATVSRHIAGGSNFNRKQADQRGDQLDRAQAQFDAWLKAAREEARQDVLDARTDEQKAADTQARRETAEREQQDKTFKEIASLAGELAGHMREGRTASAADYRKWASPKINQLIESASDNRKALADYLNKVDKRLQDVGGLLKVVGPRSKAGKQVFELLQANTLEAALTASFPEDGSIDGLRQYGRRLTIEAVAPEKYKSELRKAMEAGKAPRLVAAIRAIEQHDRRSKGVEPTGDRYSDSQVRSLAGKMRNQDFTQARRYVAQSSAYLDKVKAMPALDAKQFEVDHLELLLGSDTLLAEQVNNRPWLNEAVERLGELKRELRNHKEKHTTNRRKVYEATLSRDASFDEAEFKSWTQSHLASFKATGGSKYDYLLPSMEAEFTAHTERASRRTKTSKADVPDWTKATFTEYLAGARRNARGEMDYAEYRAMADAMLARIDAVRAEIGGMTKPKILDTMGTWFTMQHKGDKKDQLVQSATDSLVASLHLGRGMSFGISELRDPNGRINKYGAAIKAVTEQQHSEWRASQQQAAQEADQRTSARLKAIRNPETLDEFREFVRLRGEQALSDQQRATYDRLKAETTRPEPVEQAALGEPVEGKHGKTGETIYNVKVQSRLSRDTFKQAADNAKAMGGGYWRGNFWFKDKATAERFRQGEPVELAEDNSADKLKAMAERLEQDAQQRLNAERKENTAKRMREADSARQAAGQDARLANIMRAIAEADSPLLKGVTQKVQITLLDSLVRRLKYRAPDELRRVDSNGDTQFNADVTPETRVRYTQFPLLDMHRNAAEDLAQAMTKTKGYMQAGKALAKTVAGTKGNDIALPEAYPHLSKMRDYLRTEADRYHILAEAVADYGRLARMGITDRSSLRAALLDYMRLAEGVSSGAPQASRLDQLQRDLQRAVTGNRNAYNDFFPTPDATASELVDLAEIKPGMKVLEPSAGNGQLADAAQQAGGQVDAVEIAGSLREILQEKGHKLVASNFLEMNAGPVYDRVIMNPPFSKDQDIQHVRHAYTMLKPGGRLVAIVSATAGDRQNSNNRQFREWLDELSASEQALPEGAFKSSLNPTAVRTKVVIIDKPRQQRGDSDLSAMDLSAMGVDQPMPNWRPTYRQAGVPTRPADGTFDIGGNTVELKPEDNPTRREGIRVMVEDLIGPRLYQGKVKGKARLGFYRKSNSEVRIANYDDVEVMAHELAHYLDFHYQYQDRFSDAYQDPNYQSEVQGLSYTSNPKQVDKEGFAEFVRLWLTNYREAETHAPGFTARFEAVIGQDKRLEKKLRNLQREMHRWYLQGPRAQLRAKSGKNLSQTEQIIQYMQSYPFERYRQEAIDKIHGAKVVERTLRGEVRDAALSPYKQFQMVNGAESMHEAIMKDGTPELKPDGTYGFSGKGLNAVFWPVSKQGWKQFDLLMDYFKARRAQELMEQGRERLFTQQEISAGLSLAQDHPEFVQVFDEYQAFNGRMLDFYQQMGLIDATQRQAFAEANKSYVPFHRVIERLEDGQPGGSAGVIGPRLTGGQQNVRDIAENIVEGLAANVRAALIARAKQTLYADVLKSQDGSLFATKLAPDSKLVKVEQEQMAAKIAEAMAAAGLTVSQDGMIVAGDPNADATDVTDIAQALEQNPELLNFWTFGHKPTTSETYVDSAIIDGKRVWLEVRNPLLVDMLTGLRGLKSGALLNAMFRVKNLQTRTVTSMLQFLGPNAIRDTTSAYVISKNRFIPVVDTLIGMGHTIMNTELFKEFRLQGGGYGTRIEARTEETRKRRQLDLPSRNLWDTAAKLLAGYDRFASAFEYGSRVGDYRKGRMAGKNALEAAWEAREVSTDFSKMGRNELWAKFLRTVPFMNAGIQGLDKTAREVFEMRGEMKGRNLVKLHDAKVRFMLAGGSLTLMTLILWLLNADDERYQALTPDQKARFWWVFIPGTEKPLKIPRPYDIGHIFATVPEVALDYVKDRDGKTAAKTLAWTFANTLGVGDYPGILQPFIEVARNKKFTGAPVVPESMMNAPAEYQFTDRTPQIYRDLGTALKVSPLVAEHYTKGFLRYVEAYIADGSEALLWNKDQWGERPFSRGPTDYLTYQFQGQRVPYRTKWTEGYFELKKKAAGARAALRLLTAQAIRDGEPLDQFAADKVNQTLIGMDQAFNQIDRAFADQNAVLAAIKYDKSLSAEQKERRIEAWYAQKNTALATFYRQVDKALTEVEKALP